MKTTDAVAVTIPGDKSISHRALMLGVLGSGRSVIRSILDSEDTRATAEVLRALGARIPALSNNMVIDGCGLRGLQAPTDILNCGNSGTTARLMMGIVAGHPFRAQFDGDASLRSRPMRRVTGPLVAMGARIRELELPDRLPLEVAGGALRDVSVENEKSSAQVKSAILLAALVGGVRSSVCEPVHSRDHTERMLRAMGVEVRTVVDHGGMCVEIDPIDTLRPADIDVPGDFSSAAFFLAFGLLSRAIRIENVGVNSTRTGFLDVARRMGAHIHVEGRELTGGEPTATLIAEPCTLRATQVEPAEIPHLVDEVPILAVLAARAEGETRIHGAGELRVKETDRLHAIAANLRAVGVVAEERGDELVIQGSDRRLAGRIVTHGDHRIAMAFGILGSMAGNDIEVDDSACVAVSFPTFWQQLGECSV